MRISDWSSDVCSSDLGADRFVQRRRRNTGDAPHDRALLHLRHELLAQEGEQRKAAQQRHESTDHYHPFACQRLMQQGLVDALDRSEEHTSELQSLMRISYAVFCLKKNNTTYTNEH